GLLAIPDAARSVAVNRALDAGAAFLLSRDPAVADYPYRERVSSTWQHLGLPLSYWSDVLETLENLVGLGYGADPRLDHAFDLVLAKRDASGRWRMENTINGKSWVDIEAKGQPSKWVTLRALRTLRGAGRLPAA
ncbi:MAG TPA: nitrogen fixation protein NifH, partial [Dehalococcoidia bacterium]